jgi:acyl transferase domain-containing protein
MCLPVYRRTVEAIDAIFASLAGWSLRARQASMTDQDLMETQYAQPVTFMVQVSKPSRVRQ